MFSRRMKKRLKGWLADRRMILLNLNEGEERQTLDLVRRVRREVHMEVEYIEGCQLIMAVRRTAKVPGALAEVGVYQGGSARLICEARGDKPLHLFDTFAGIPAVDTIDAPFFSPGDWSAPLDKVKAYLARFENVHFHVGVFPQTAGPVSRERFSFVNLDVDTHRSTADCLAFFYPRLNPGGVIVSHDYRWAPGVRTAFDDFFANRPEPVFALSGSQCMVVKLGEGDNGTTGG
jgi:predicted O-methyltransferase YrrM